MDESILEVPAIHFATDSTVLRDFANMNQRSMVLSGVSLKESQHISAENPKPSSALDGASSLKEKLRKRKEALSARMSNFDDVGNKENIFDVKSPEFKMSQEEEPSKPMRNPKRTRELPPNISRRLGLSSYQKTSSNSEFGLENQHHLKPNENLSQSKAHETINFSREDENSFGMARTLGKNESFMAETLRSNEMNPKNERLSELDTSRPLADEQGTTPVQTKQENSFVFKDELSFSQFHESMAKEHCDLVKFPSKNSEILNGADRLGAEMATSRVLSFTGSKSFRERPSLSVLPRKSSRDKLREEKMKETEGPMDQCRRIDGFLRKLEKEFWDLDRAMTKFAVSAYGKSGGRTSREASPFMKSQR